MSDAETTPTAPTDLPTPADPTRPQALRWLDAGVPLSLLMDLADPRGPESHAILLTESGPAMGDPMAATPQRRTGREGIHGVA